MNDWYIDRSKNFVNDKLNDAIKCFKNNCLDSIESTALVELLKRDGILGNASGNPNAALTRFRDHGFLNKNNIIGDTAFDYIVGKLTKSEMIIDLLLKRPAKKDGSPNVKPLILICQLFSNMIEMGIDDDDIFITYNECYEYLYPINNYFENDFELVEKILSEREYELDSILPISRVQMDSNEEINISIWFNALFETPIFMSRNDNRRILRPNLKQKEFFRYIAINAEEFSETPTNSNSKLYDYYSNKKTGLLEVIPSVIIPNVVIDEHDIKIIFDYLFGYQKISNFDYKKYLKYECFGIFFPFITLPGLIIRKIELYNKQAAEKFYDFIRKNENYYILNENTAFNSRNALSIFVEKGLANEIDSFVSNFEIKRKAKNLVVFGTPGCGKSYYVNNTLLKNYPNKSDNTKERVFRTTFYQDYTNTDFVGQILPYIEYNEKKEEKVTYKFTPGPFALALKEAVLNRNEDVSLVIEELNRGNAPAIFGDIFQLLDRNQDGISEYAITNIHLRDWLNHEIDGANFDKIKIPGNLNIYATMNTSDQNVFTLDTAFKRRWEFKKLKNEFKSHPYEDYFVPGLEETTWKTFVEVINKAIVGELGERNSSINVSDKQIGVYFVDKDGLHKEQINTSDLIKDEKIDKFAYKIFSYLWEDVAKFDKDQLFKKGIITLDQLIENYIKHEVVFNDSINDSLKKKDSDSSEN